MNKVAVFSALLLLPPLSAFAGTIHVPSDQLTIQAGIDAASYGDTVLVSSGYYTGVGNRDIEFKGKSIVLKSEHGPDSTIIDCQATESEFHRGIVISIGSDESTKIHGFTITGGHTGDQGGAIYCSRSFPRIENCIFYKNQSNNKGGAFYCTQSSPAISNCVFGNNTAEEGGGLYCTGGSEPEITNCTFSDNFAVKGGAICCWLNSSFSVGRSIIAFTEHGGAIYWNTGTVPTLTCCNIYGNTGGDWVEPFDAQENISGNFSRHPIFCDRASGDYHLEIRSPCLPGGNSSGVLIGALGLGCEPEYAVWHINADGTGDAPTIQAGIDSAMHGDTVLLGDGFYIGSGNRNIEFNGKLVVVVSEHGPTLSIMDCVRNTSRVSRGFKLHAGEDSTAVIQGLTIRNGDGGQYGGAIEIDGCSPSIRECVIYDNSALLGGGICCRNSASPTIVNCSVVSNRIRFPMWGNSGAGIACLNSSPRLYNCIIAFNDSGGAVHVSDFGFPEFACCDIYGNIGGDWNDSIADQVSVNGNFSADPMFCVVSERLLHLTGNSPCTPENSPCGEWIGALPIGCGWLQTIMEPDTMHFLYAYSVEPMFGNVFLGDFAAGFSPSHLDTCSILVNGAIEPSAVELLPSHPDFCGETWKIAFPMRDFILAYGSLWDTTARTYTVSGLLDDTITYDAKGSIVFLGLLCGDIDADGTINIIDVTRLVNYLYREGPAPELHETADVDMSKTLNIIDAARLINYLYKDGQRPVCQ